MDALKQKVDADRRIAQSTQRRLVTENSALIGEINELRREVQILKEKGAAAPPAGGEQSKEGLPLSSCAGCNSRPSHSVSLYVCASHGASRLYARVLHPLSCSIIWCSSNYD